jgi:hypothetical protein
MTKENCINEMLQKIDGCKDNTAYTEGQIQLMKDNGTKLLNCFYDLQGTTYTLIEEKEEPKDVVIEFEKFMFGHNDFQIYCDDYLVKKCMKEIFSKMKEEEKIGSHGSNGYGTALVISYECYKELK